MLRRPPVRRPLPHVAGHVVQAESVGRERADRRRRAVAVVVTPGEITVPVVRQPLPRTLRFVAPHEGGTVEAAASRPFPLRLGRQCLARPSRRRPQRPRRRRARPGWSAWPSSELPGPSGCAPRGAWRPPPPLVEVAQVDGTGGHREHHRPGHEVLRRSAGEVGRVERSLGDRHVAGRRDELVELAVGHLEAVDPEPVDVDGVRRRLLARSGRLSPSGRCRPAPGPCGEGSVSRGLRWSRARPSSRAPGRS